MGSHITDHPRAGRFVGFEVISKVPNTLHTPLMSGTNAIQASFCWARCS